MRLVFNIVIKYLLINLTNIYTFFIYLYTIFNCYKIIELYLKNIYFITYIYIYIYIYIYCKHNIIR